jgi:hypothetical protein
VCCAAAATLCERERAVVLCVSVHRRRERGECERDVCAGSEMRELILLLSACSDISVHREREREQEGDVDGRGQRREDGE